MAWELDTVIKKHKCSKFLQLKLDLSRFMLDPVDKPRDDRDKNDPRLNYYSVFSASAVFPDFSASSCSCCCLYSSAFSSI
ncbi:MAG TPA: palindromic element RPE4 domain-containing protein [Rickettsia endosymbiont of Pyrocoelia pectoralis]|nr:palindromic element RPE4 domain-containing protein [Rickettsia endosymbiont of Pyrocoelia pectoralis]